eukprot:TRINITY_DN13747_c0_g2_i1.p2 TRINITY_DN13747_c0_g2~~TRINITY_DN13747_c0_g2_i1.p2  ORF type:complete len:147 (+),score=3.91 TRINITY_DN13747_c0_g2_i1:825-1265(+)
MLLFSLLEGLSSISPLRNVLGMMDSKWIGRVDHGNTLLLLRWGLSLLPSAVFTTSTGFLAYPELSKDFYMSNVHLCWRIQCAAQLTLTFSEFKLQDHADYCPDHVVFEQNGLVRSSHFCGAKTFPNYQPTRRGDLVIHFESNGQTQ